MLKDDIYILAIALDWRMALLSNGDIVPITNLVYDDDDEAQNLDAHKFVCGIGSDFRVALVRDFGC